MGEGAYDLPSTPPNPGANHAVWFDRDGVDQWQAQMWGAIEGVTYNTGGIYEIVITLHATSDTTAEAYMTINGEPQGFYDPAWHSGPADLMPAGMTFTGDMEHLQVFYGLYGYGATHAVAFENITVYGTFGTPFAQCSEQLIDIKPGSDPNSINLKKKGLTPVAILGSDSFDVANIDPSTLSFSGASPAHDLMDPVVLSDHYEDVNGDGWTDLVSHYNTQELGLSAGTYDLYLTGETFVGEPFWGADEVRCK
jgi:hypothetical protein